MATRTFTARVRTLAAFALLLAIPMQPPAAHAWGDQGHTWINRVAALNIPASMPTFLRRASTQIAYLGPEPDRWRRDSEPALKRAQEPDHFIDLELLAELKQLPPNRYEFYRYLYEKRRNAIDPDQYLPERIGLQPYATIEIYERLKVAFREYRRLRSARQPTAAAEQNAIYYAGWLGHYVADAANPMHTSIHHNGWTGANPRGYTTSKETHRKFEADFVDRNQARLQFAHLLRPPARLEHPFENYVDYLRHSSQQVEQLYAIEKRGGFNDTGSKEGLEFVRRCMADGAQMLLDLWYTAWLESEVAP
ncbi:MAG: nuclease [Candidatus Korobacteraceae bacterium]